MVDRAKMPQGTLVAALRHAGCVFAEEEATILLEQARSQEELVAMLARRIEGQPLEHIVGWAQFHGQRIQVGPGVFVPRRRSEFLVERALAVLFADDLFDGDGDGDGDVARATVGGPAVSSPPASTSESHRAVVLDLCCGSGAIGAALAQALEQRRSAGHTAYSGNLGCHLHAADIDPAAVACASENIADVLGAAYCGDLFAALPESLRGRIDMIVANAPYVPSEAIEFMPAEARIYEPDSALNGGVDGLEMHRRIAEEAPQWLAPGGVLLLESSERQAATTASILASQGFSTSIASNKGLQGTVVTGRRKLTLS